MMPMDPRGGGPGNPQGGLAAQQRGQGGGAPGGGLPAAGQTAMTTSQRFLLEDFGSINTKAKRTSIDDNEFAWLENLMPIGAGNLRSLYDNGAAIYTTSAPRTIREAFSYNLAAVQYFAVFLDNGTAVQVRASDGATTTISATADEFRCSGSFTPGCAQWGSKYLLIVVDHSILGDANGYFIWDGTNLFAPGSLQPQVTITNAGAGYTGTATVGFSGGAGSGATATATITNQSISAITITNPGTGYVIGDTVTVTITGTHTVLATATVTIMPFGVSGLTVEVFSGRIWIAAPLASPTTVTFSAPNNVGDFSTANGGGSFVAADSFLRYRITCLKQSNGFLYYFGDSSINVISNVQTSGSPATTTFNNSNVDPQVGTQWRDCIQPFGRAIVFANPAGVYALYGGAAEKVSDQLDGIFADANFSSFTPTASVMTIFGIKCYILEVLAPDPLTTVARRYMCLWDGRKWFLASQTADPTSILLQELNSDINAWGVDSTRLFPLFSTASNDLKKWYQSKLWVGDGNIIVKQALRAYVQVFNNVSGDPIAITLTIDTDFTGSNPVTLAGAGVVTWVNASNQVVQFQNALLQNVFWIVTGYVFLKANANAFGSLMGETMISYTQDFVIVSASILYQNYQVDS